MWELGHKESCMLKNWCFWIVVLEKTLESPLDCKEMNSVNPKGKQPWIFIGRTDAEAPILWPPDAKSWLTGRDPDAGRLKGMAEDEMVGWHHRLSGHEFEQTLGDSEGQGSLVCMRLQRGGHNWATEQQMKSYGLNCLPPKFITLKSYPSASECDLSWRKGLYSGD